MLEKKTYLLREIEPDVWNRVKERARGEARTVKSVVLQLLCDYADGQGRGDHLLRPIKASYLKDHKDRGE